MTEPKADLVRNLDELMNRLEVASLEELSERVDEYADWDGWVPPIDEQLDLPWSLTICVRDRGIGMRFPFTLGDMWEVVDELEDECTAAAEAEEE